MPDARFADKIEVQCRPVTFCGRNLFSSWLSMVIGHKTLENQVIQDIILQLKFGPQAVLLTIPGGLHWPWPGDCTTGIPSLEVLTRCKIIIRHVAFGIKVINTHIGCLDIRQLTKAPGILGVVFCIFSISSGHCLNRHRTDPRKKAIFVKHDSQG